ncbi:MAG: class I SAM-dependent methyltransferase [Bryobacterales bacterium]|nr:class I SAM-dependent methyltransferase [Bryobacterales bacterium]
MSDYFNLAEEYESMLNQGIALSGESMQYFAQGRIAAMKRLLGADASLTSILDFGCGLGVGSRILSECFPQASVVGADTARNALAAAREASDPNRIRYITVEELEAEPLQFDLCYVNGVFHHVPLAERPAAIGLIANRLRPGGYLFLFENNPWNPGTRLVMSRIPFDRDAIPLSIPTARRLTTGAGLAVEGIESLFFFPRPLAFLRPLERTLSGSRLGAQYLVWSRKS